MSHLTEKLKEQKDFFARKPVSMEEINAAERILNVVFSDEYKAYIAELGAATIHGHELTGICRNRNVNVVDETTQARSITPEIPEDFYVIENTHYDGILIWQDKEGNIYSSGSGLGVKKLASSIEAYLKI